ncbi:hypothetical protein [Rhizobium tubonense]|uniref:Adenylate cyclase n=1 Tax=Rhizobium tubonense TaxID=484088 RepID=A0A2W4EMH1_9HYPH|nr:hypothetical protein [Rhizobium tubonense]PZM14896.1 hypothetical protein CPY51_09395 [Rhizobium tubonense]
MERAIRLNPFHPPWYHAHTAGAFYLLGRYADCVRSTCRLPEIGGWSFRLAAAYAQLGRLSDASREAKTILLHEPTFTVDDFMARTILLEHDPDRTALRDGLLKAGLPL